MLRSFYIVVALFISAKGSAQGFSATTDKHLQAVLTSFQTNNQNPVVGGISAAIVVDGIATWKGAVGYAARNIDQNNNLLPGGLAFVPQTPSRIYSVTKTFTAALVLELQREGAINLGDKIVKYLPLLPQVNPALNSDVTIEQLLAHESGYSDYTAEINLQIAVAFNPSRLWNPYEMASFVHQLAPPGSERRYSSTNYILLGAIIEAATGRTVAHHFRTRFFTPLGLNSMSFSIQESRQYDPAIAAPHDDISPFNPIFSLTGQPTFPSGYTNISRFSLNGILSLAFTSGGIVSDAVDLARWGNALFGARATAPETVEAVLKSISATPDEDGDKLGYGVFENNKISTTDRFVGHDGNAPGYRSVMYYQPERKMTIVVLTNYHGLDIYAVARKLYEKVPDFLCGNGDNKENKVQLCFQGKSMCIARQAADNLIAKGATLGTCDGSTVSIRSTTKANVETAHTALPGRFIVFPNPATGSSTIQFTAKAAGPVLVELFSIDGALLTTLFQGHMLAEEQRNWRMNIGSLTPGAYMVRVKSATGSSNKKLIVQ